MSNLFAPSDRNIRSIAAYVRGLWDWTFLNECFTPTRIRVADVDGIVERHGHFLWIEAKPERYTEHVISRGQQLTHDALHRNGAFTIITVWGYTQTDMASEEIRNGDATAMLCGLGDPVPTYIRVWLEHADAPYEMTTDRTHFQSIVRDWFRWADNPRTPKR